MSSPITPESLGAAGDGIADDSTSLEAAMNSGKPIELIGRYRITRPVAVGVAQSVRGLTMLGYGRQSQIILDSMDARVYVELPYISNPWGPNTQALLLRDFVIVPNKASSVTAFSCQTVAASGSAEPTFMVDNVHVVPSGTDKYTDGGLHLHNMRNGSVTNCHILGRYASFPSNMGQGGALTITSSAYPPRANPVSIAISRCQFTWFSKGLFLHGSGTNDPNNPSDWQGVTVRDSVFLACWNGVHAWTSDKFSAHFQVSGCHFNVYSYGIYAPNVWHFNYTGNNFQWMDGLTSAVGIDCSASGQNWPMFGHVRDNFMSFNRSQPLSSAIGVFCGASGGNPGGAWSVVRDNSFWRGNCASLTPVYAAGGTVYNLDNRVPI